MDAAWIEALVELWKSDDEYDFGKLEKEYQLKPLEKRGTLPTSEERPDERDSLLVCLTGFGDQREQIAEKIIANGGRYTGDLTRKCTHLIVAKPEGKKFVAAKSWGIYPVTLAWLDNSIARGMILEEARYDPMLPEKEQGLGAWLQRDPQRASLGKRSRSMAAIAAEEGPRKLRKTASMKLNTQRDNIWGDILGRSTSREYSFAHEQSAAPQAPEPQVQQPAPEEQGVFANCYFFVHGFTEQRTAVLEQTIFTLNGSICGSLEQVATAPVPREPAHRFLILPQTSQPDTHPQIPYENLHIITEYYIERCLHNKHFFPPNEAVLGRPFPLFPIPGFSDLTICTAAFTGIELNQVARGVAQLGGKFQEEFRKNTSVLVCRSLSVMRKEKLKMALKWGVPVVSADWLWECISTGYNVPPKDFIFPELKDHYHESRLNFTLNRPPSKAAQRKSSEPTSKPPKPIPKPPSRAGLDSTAFDRDSPKKPRKGGPTRQESTVSADFATAREHPVESHDEPLAEVSSAKLNKSPSPTKQPLSLARSKSDPNGLPISDHLPHNHQPASLPSNPPQAQAPDHKDPPPKDTTTTTNLPQPPSDAVAAKHHAKAAARLALSSKLTTILHPAPEPPSHAQPLARPRTRKIMGRAVSNASNASNSSADFVATTVSAESFRDPTPPPPPTTQLEYRDPEALEARAALMKRDVGSGGPVRSQSTTIVGGRALRKRG